MSTPSDTKPDPESAKSQESPAQADEITTLTEAEFSLPSHPELPLSELHAPSRPPAAPPGGNPSQGPVDPGAAEEEGPPSSRDSGEVIDGHGRRPTGKRLAALCLSALGIVYGDIGTSPLYALRECFAAQHGVAVTEANVLGVLSLIFWALTITVSIKYVAYVLRADNRGEGGILALMALATSKSQAMGGRRMVMVLLGLFGAALLYGDGMITPAISVLSAVEGLGVSQPALIPLVKPITIVILVGLFFFQKYGTTKVGRIFGPITALWFIVIATLGAWHVMANPHVLLAFSPHYGAEFLIHNRLIGFFALGSVLLVVTGGEALYADMGHFGTRPIRVTWFAFVLPSLFLNYLGQGALLLDHPEAAEHVFFELAPAWGMLPLTILSTVATIIASQALISGAFSITRQATMLGYWPRVRVNHTSEHEMGQIYVPSINWMLMFATIALVLTFGSSSNLAAAYGMAVTTTMVITTALAYIVAVHVWGWPVWQAALLTTLFMVVDFAFFGATLLKFIHGGWVPVAVASAILLLMTTWKRGRVLIAERVVQDIIPLEDFFEVMRIERPARVPGTAVFMTSNSDGTPPALMLNFQHNRVVHQQVILLTVVTEPVSFVHNHERVSVEDLSNGFVRVVARYGFMEVPDMRQLLLRKDTPTPPIEHTTFFIGRESLNIVDSKGMAKWRKRLFSFMAQNGVRVTSFFSLPSDRVAELGGQIDL
ncbi:MAG TPA: potassium transporter Kup [Polyangiaceae bacterium]|nr:potassium transporter Kup [Polyangiaceae bacterium]